MKSLIGFVVSLTFLLSIEVFSVVAFGQGYPPPLPSPPPFHNPPNYGGLQQYRQEEANAIYWSGKYDEAPSGSWEEGYCRDQRSQSIQRALEALRGYQVFDRMSSSAIENFADEQDRKYQATASGSALEDLYAGARDVAYAAFQRQLQIEVDNFGRDWRQMDEYALMLDGKYQATPSGSAKERAYDQARRLVFDRLPEAVRLELSQTFDFRLIEQVGLYFIGKYDRSPSGSVAEAAYRRTYDLALRMAVERFEYNSYSYSQNDLYYINDEYNRKFDSAPSGSQQESYFRQIRDIARRALDRGHFVQ
jgi:hypothetical protein